MAEYRLGRSWAATELDERLEGLKRLSRNFSVLPEQMTLENGWHQYYSQSVVARERPGAPEADGPFERCRLAVMNYEFSDRSIVTGHFDPYVPLLGRPMLLEVKAFRFLHYLSGVLVSAVRSEENENETVFGFRYDTLEGHIERGYEWFLLKKEHETGDIRFRIEAAWQPGQFPNWWSRVGFSLVAPHYQRAWHRRAHALLAEISRDPNYETADYGSIVDSETDIEFRRIRARRLRQEGG